MLFAFSKNIDTYVNVVSSIYDQIIQRSQYQFTLAKVVLVRVRNTTTSLNENEVNLLLANILIQIRKLSEEKYISYFNQEEINVTNTTGIGIYKKVNNLDFEISSLDYQNLKKGIDNLIKKYGGLENCIFDLSAGTKISTFDIYSICMALRVKYVFIFELSEPFDKKKPQNSLYHYVKLTQKYRHINISNNLPISESQKSLISTQELRIPVTLILIFIVAVLFIIAIYGNITNVYIQILNITAIIITIITPVLNLINRIKN